MSLYYSFYVGYTLRGEDSIFHLYGPYDRYHRLLPILVKDRVSTGDLHEAFHKLTFDQVDEELKERFSYKISNHADPVIDLFYLDSSELSKMSDNFIKDGYFSIQDIETYLQDTTEGFYFRDRLSCVGYSKLLSNAVRNNNQSEIERLQNFEYFCYPDYLSKEFAVFILKEALKTTFDEYYMFKYVQEYEHRIIDKVVILMSVS